MARRCLIHPSACCTIASSLSCVNLLNHGSNTVGGLCLAPPVPEGFLFCLLTATLPAPFFLSVRTDGLACRTDVNPQRMGRQKASLPGMGASASLLARPASG